MAHHKTQAEWETEMAEKIFLFVKHELYLELRFLEPALSALSLCRRDGLLTFATDGRYLFASPEWLMRIFRQNALFLDRAYLHTALHCMFRHLWMGKGRDARIWHAACDIAVERVIDGLELCCTRRILNLLRKDTYESLKREEGGVSAAVIYRWLKRRDEAQIAALAREFFTDDHRFWPNEEELQKPLIRRLLQEWDRKASQSALLFSRRGLDPSKGEEAFAAQIRVGRARRSYADFLRKFAALREEAHLSAEEFDMGFYSYGLRLYGKMPLIEPLETREAYKIRDFVIVIDTSYSTEGELVKGFLRETAAILSRESGLFGECAIRVIQCDDQVRTDQRIFVGEAEEILSGGFSIVGGGGTDFRPAFSYVDRLREAGELAHLGGLLYFTDGKGIYPAKKPDYQTAFLFLGDYGEDAPPPWAMRLRLEPEEWMK